MQRSVVHNLVDTLFDLRGKVVPPSAGKHFRAARREALLGIKEVVDAALDRLDEADAEAEDPEKPTAIPLED